MINLLLLSHTWSQKYRQSNTTIDRNKNAQYVTNMYYLKAILNQRCQNTFLHEGESNTGNVYCMNNKIAQNHACCINDITSIMIFLIQCLIILFNQKIKSIYILSLIHI